MKNKILFFGVGLIALAALTGFLVYQVVSSGKKVEKTVEEVPKEEFEPLDPAIIVEARKSRSADNTVVLSVRGMGSKVTSVAYELTYDSQSLIKGVNSGSKPIDTAGKDTFEREVYLGTCSRNICKPDLGVKKVSVVLEFTSSSGKKSQFSKDFEL